MKQSRWCPAKINLFLEIPAKRSDGYHEIQTLMVPVNLADRLEITPNDHLDELSLTCSDPNLILDSSNLICRAVEAWRQSSGIRTGWNIHLRKNIPWAAGLGGGSSDAAGTLRLLQAITGTPDDKQLHQLAARLGSDINFFLVDSAAWCTGRGEIVTPVPTAFTYPVILVKPVIGLSTPKVFQQLQVPSLPLPGGQVLQAFQSGRRIELAKTLWNRLEEPALKVAPELKSLKEQLTQWGATTLMSGSGSAFFLLCRDANEQEKIWQQLCQAKFPTGQQAWKLNTLTGPLKEDCPEPPHQIWL